MIYIRCVTLGLVIQGRTSHYNLSPIRSYNSGLTSTNWLIISTLKYKSWWHVHVRMSNGETHIAWRIHASVIDIPIWHSRSGVHIPYPHWEKFEFSQQCVCTGPLTHLMCAFTICLSHLSFYSPPSLCSFFLSLLRSSADWSADWSASLHLSRLSLDHLSFSSITFHYSITIHCLAVSCPLPVCCQVQHVYSHSYTLSHTHKHSHFFCLSFSFLSHSLFLSLSLSLSLQKKPIHAP